MTKEVVELGCVSGLGDMLARSFLFDPYFYLSNVRHPVEVLLFSPNPYVAELFEFHPNRKNMRLHTFAMYPHFEKGHYSMGKASHEDKLRYRAEFLKGILGEDFKMRPQLPLSPEVVLNFYPNPTFRLRLMYWRRFKYAVIQPFTSDKHKDVPAPILKDVIRTLVGKGLHVYLVIRDNVRVHHNNQNFSARDFLMKNVLNDLPESKKVEILELSVPLVIELIKHASLFVGGCSAFVKAAWHYKRPAILLLPKDLIERPSNRQQMDEGKGIYFGATLPTSWTRTFEDFNIDQMKKFISDLSR